MLRYLLLRPIAVSMTLLVALVLSVIAYTHLPVLLLPTLDVPVITITIRYPNGSPEEIEQSILKPIRESMLTLGGIKTSESVAQNEVVICYPGPHRLIANCTKTISSPAQTISGAHRPGAECPGSITKWTRTMTSMPQ